MPSIASSSTLRYITKRKIPKLVGSQAVFLIVVIALALLVFIISSVAAFRLFRRRLYGPEREAIHQGGRRYRPTTDASHFNYTPAATLSQPTTWKAKLNRLFGSLSWLFGSRKKSGRDDGARGSHRWMQASSGDEWDANAVVWAGQRHSQVPSQELRERERINIPFSVVHPTHRPAPMDEPFPPPTITYAQTQPSTSTLHLDLNLPGPLDPTGLYKSFTSLAPEPSIIASSYRLPRSSSPDTLSSVPCADEGSRAYARSPLQRELSIRTSPSSQSDSPIRLATSPQSTLSISPQSGTPVRTFPGGTKFIESL